MPSQSKSNQKTRKEKKAEKIRGKTKNKQERLACKGKRSKTQKKKKGGVHPM